MQIVIDITEDDFIKAKEDSKNHLLDRVWNAVANGTPLPKGCGDLIDKNELIKNGVATKDYLNTFIDTIIEADKGE